MTDPQSSERRKTGMLRPVVSGRKKAYPKSEPNRKKRATTIEALVAENQLLADGTDTGGSYFAESTPIVLHNPFSLNSTQLKDPRYSLMVEPIVLSANSSPVPGRYGIGKNYSIPYSPNRRSQRIANQGGSPNYARIAFPMRRFRVAAPRVGEKPAKAPIQPTPSTLPQTPAVVQNTDLPPVWLSEQQIASFWNQCLRDYLSYGEATDKAHAYNLRIRSDNLVTEQQASPIAQCRKFGTADDIGFFKLQFRDLSTVADLDCWKLGEVLLIKRLPAAYQYKSDGTAKAIHGAVVVGEYIRFYKSLEVGKVSIIEFENHQDTLHMEANYLTITEHLTAIRQEWTREKAEPEPEEWMTWINEDYWE
ncbi:hypothetical protein BO94DRAFT_581132 [Aspergillus sclerotioniger CBS 115572]|uniref:Uncharacterized protein n=1 Tax=Aspergillus sclerotioniger CBS 115572 TaxID=1450535 RepID=A0A317XBQ8_9EURO|nr:hypothetical protein BO94DRAFT_581132 [Aspergillus sclerotioniger CBS 115572]PWY95983.1 hypothetical protein BO94DRAFT_581132 [Aspergillus sclerotioniger CBS 115572]